MVRFALFSNEEDDGVAMDKVSVVLLGVEAENIRDGFTLQPEFEDFYAKGLLALEENVVLLRFSEKDDGWEGILRRFWSIIFMKRRIRISVSKQCSIIPLCNV